MKKFNISFTFSATIVVEAEDEDLASQHVEQMSDEELFGMAKDGFEIQWIEER